MTELLYSNKVELRFNEDGKSVYVFTPYHKKFVNDLKQTFNSKEALGTAYGLDPGAEWDSVLKCWLIHTGWMGCEDWYNTLIELLNKYYPEEQK